MPRGDGTGPMGTWTNCSGRPALGRGAGRAMGAGFGRGAGIGRGVGFGAGYGLGTRYVNNPVYSASEEKAFLENRAQVLETELAAVKSQLSASVFSETEKGTSK